MARRTARWDAVRALLPEDHAAPATDDPEAIEAQLAEIVATASAAWPAVLLDEGDFLAELARRLPAGPPIAEALTQVRATDLYLAAACARGLPGAVATFEARLVPDMRTAVEQSQLPGIAVDEVVQAVRERLLVGSADEPPRITQYTGRGDLRSWLRVVAVREALVRLRRSRREMPASERRLERLLDDETDPELAYLKDLYREEFRAAVEEAMSRLESRDRNLLRYHYLDGLTLEELAALYHVHRATVARRIARVRNRLLDETQVALREHLRVSEAEFHSLVRLLRSQIEVSVRRLLDEK